MARRYRADHREDQGFIRWARTARCRDRQSSLPPDPAIVVDQRRLYNYLDSLEGLSGE